VENTGGEEDAAVAVGEAALLVGGRMEGAEMEAFPPQLVEPVAREAVEVLVKCVPPKLLNTRTHTHLCIFIYIYIYI